MIDDIERAQRALEGKCVHCGKTLPEHDADCVYNPYKQIVDWLHANKQRLKKFIDKDTQK